jgi:NAD(P)-dependent dehydrogenase (short-subunit alcohol dehydrogenase family)
MILKGKTAVITGSTSGIGLAYAKALAAEGVNVTINGFGKPEDIEKERVQIERQYRVSAVYLAADMTKPAEIQAMIAQAAAKFGRLDILINNAGIQFVSPVEDFPAEKWDQIIAINLSAAFHAIRHAVPIMKAAKWGRIISTASTHSLVASPFKSACEARHRRAHQDDRAGGRHLWHHLQLHQPGLCLDAAGGEPDSRHHEGTSSEPRAGHQRRAAAFPADQAVRHSRTGRSHRGLSLL